LNVQSQPSGEHTGDLARGDDATASANIWQWHYN
jgi:hypothetical protein